MSAEDSEAGARFSDESWAASSAFDAYVVNWRQHVYDSVGIWLALAASYSPSLTLYFRLHVCFTSAKALTLVSNRSICFHRKSNCFFTSLYNKKGHVSGALINYNNDNTRKLFSKASFSLLDPFVKVKLDLAQSLETRDQVVMENAKVGKWLCLRCSALFL